MHAPSETPDDDGHDRRCPPSARGRSPPPWSRRKRCAPQRTLTARRCDDQVMIVSTPFVPGHRIERTVGMVWGTVVRSRGIGYQLMAGIRSMAGGEINEFTDMLNNARQHALDRMRAMAEQMGANAVIAVGFDSSELGQSMSEVLAYGTAVVVVPDDAASSPVRLA
jgi:uncharacterized protein YbjQ (UPF0145 family)